MTTFNINDTVRVKLTDLGREIHELSHKFEYPSLPYTEPIVDADGWTEFRLWELMSTFGTNIRFTPFDLTIELVESWALPVDPMDAVRAMCK